METLRVRLVLLATAVAAATATTAHAQSPPAQSSWRITSGYGWFSQRDVARFGQPVDDSPIAWSGHGTAFEGARRWMHGNRLHELVVSTAFIRAFEYRSPLSAESRPSSDSHRVLDLIYEYRRYVKSNVFARGLDVGVGIQGLGQFASSARYIAGGSVEKESTTNAGTAIAAVARFQRWSRIGAEVVWTNGCRLGRATDTHSEVSADTPSHPSGGWLTDFTASLHVAFKSRASIVVRYDSAGEGMFASHQGRTSSRGALSAGVIYAK